MSESVLLLTLIFLVMIGSGALLIYFIRRYIGWKCETYNQQLQQQYELQYSRWKQEALNAQSTKAVAASRSTVKGQVAEQLAPLLPPMISKYKLSDLKFFGQPFDYVAINGMTDERDGAGAEIEIVIIDIKTGQASLSPIQRKIKQAIEKGRVRWETVQI